MRSVMLVLALVAVVTAHDARAQVACGDVIGKGGTTVLTGNLGPCDDDQGAAAVILDGGKLDLGGYTITCADTDNDGDVPQGVGLVGKKARVSNGTIIGCANGVLLDGDGKHTVEAITANGNLDDGIDANPGSDKNRISGCTARLNGNDGYEIASDKNKLTSDIAAENVEDGFDVVDGADKNKLTGVTSQANGDDGIEVSGDKNKLSSPTATGNGEVGIDLGGSKNKVRGGTSTGNAVLDVTDCAGNSVKKLTVGTASPDCQ